MPPEIFTEIYRLLSPKKSEKIVQKLDNVYEIFMYEIKSTDIEKLPPNLIELIITCDTFYIKSDLVDQLRGIKFTIYANNVIVSQSCTIDLSGVPHTPFLSSAGKDSKGRGLNGENGAAGESGGSFALICKTIKFVDDSILTIKSNGADGQDGQNGGDGDNGINGMDANEGSFRVNETKFGMNFKSSQDHRKMIENFGLKSSKHSSNSTVTTIDGLTGYIYYQPKKSNQYYTFMFVKGEEYGLPGKIGGRGGFGGEGGIPGQISIKIDCNEHPGRINIIQKNGADGKNGIGGLNGSKGRGGSDCWANHSSQFEPTFHIPKEPTKFKICYTEESVNSIYDESTNKYAYISEDCKITEPSNKNIRNDLPPEEEKSPKCKASKKPLIIIGDITDENSQYSQYLRDCEGGFIKKKIVTPVKNLVFRYTG